MKFIRPSALLSLILYILLVSTGCKSSSKTFLSANEFEPLPGGETLWTAEVDQSQASLISPPEKIPWFTQILLNKAEKKFGKELLPGRILTWSSDMGVGSGALEKYIEQGATEILEPRLIYLIRMKVSYFVSCPFAIDVNSWQYKEFQITSEEISGLQGRKEMNGISSLSERELTALRYSVALSQTPVSFEGQLLGDVRRLFSHQGIVAIAALAAKVNYWARLIEAWRIKPIGYSSDPVLRINEFETFSNRPENMQE